MTATRPSLARLCLAVVGGNVVGITAWQLATAVIPRLWEGHSPRSHPVALMGLVALSFVLLAAPPVLVGALSGWAAGRWQMWAGLASGLWALSLIGRVPEDFPIAPGVWYAPAVLVVLSGALGGWSVAGAGVGVRQDEG